MENAHSLIPMAVCAGKLEVFRLIICKWFAMEGQMTWAIWHFFALGITDYGLK